MAITKRKQLSLLMWKMCKLQMRRPLISIAEYLVPLAGLAFLLIVRSQTGVTEIKAPTEYRPEPVTSTDSLYRDPLTFRRKITGKHELFYAPNIPSVNVLIDEIRDVWLSTLHRLDLISILNPDANPIKGYPSEEAMITAFKSNANPVIACVVFTNVDKGSASLPKNVKYKIRPNSNDITWLTGYQFPLSPVVDTKPVNPVIDSYRYQRFLTLQYILGMGIISRQTSTDVRTLMNANNITLTRIPYPPYYKDKARGSFSVLVILFVVYTYVLIAVQIVKNIVYERELRIKEAMKVMGLDSTIYWVSWFIRYLIYFIPLMLLTAGLCAIHFPGSSAIFNKSSMSLLMVLMLLYGVYIMTSSFMLTVFFTKAPKAGMIGGVLYFLSTFPSYFISASAYPLYSRSVKMASSLFMNSGFEIAINLVIMYEHRGDGAQWSNFMTPPLREGNTSLADMMLMLTLDSCIYLFIMWYVDNVRPGEFGVPRPWNFPFTKDYWCGVQNIATDSAGVDTGEKIHESCFEKDPKLNVGIAIKHLRKKYSGGSKTVAVADMTLNIYEGQITALLGHNGAGKTTAMSMITGFLRATSGTAVVNGHDINTDTKGVRDSLGLCPQHDILFDNLRVHEHLYFFSQLKGVSSHQVRDTVDRMLTTIGLEAKRDSKAVSLSGGQKRKLSVGIALCGDSKVIVLDEPSSGMDPQARRELWDILVNMKQDRTILLSTHFMDEADVLGDRIAIMAQGVVKCCGSSLFLKTKYGAGYHLTIVKTKTCQESNVSALIRKVIPTAELHSQIATELTYSLHHDDKPQFTTLLTHLEREMSNLGISGFGLSETTMEDVFLRVGESSEGTKPRDLKSPLDDVAPASAHQTSPPEYDETGDIVSPSTFEETKADDRKRAEADVAPTSEKTPPHESGSATEKSPPHEDVETTNMVPSSSLDENANAQDNHHTVDVTTAATHIEFNSNLHRNTGVKLLLQQFMALLVKKVIHSWRNWSISLLKIFVPVFFAIMALLGKNSGAQSVKNPALVLNLDKYTKSFVPVGGDSRIANIFKNMVEDDTKVNLVSNTGDDFALTYYRSEAIKNTFKYYKSHYFIGATFGPNGINGYYSGEGHHFSAITLAYLMNSLCKSTAGEEYSIETTNEPLPKTRAVKGDQPNLFKDILDTLMLIVYMIVGIVFVSATYVILIIKERISRAKHVQISSGVPVWLYWLANFTWDLVTFIIPCSLMLVVIFVFEVEAYMGPRLGVVFLLVMYGWSSLPMTYLYQAPFQTSGGGMVFIIIFVIVTGIITFIGQGMLSILSFLTPKFIVVADVVDWIFWVIFPPYCLTKSLFRVRLNFEYLDACKRVSTKICDIVPHPCCGPYNKKCGKVGCLDYQENYLSMYPNGCGKYVIGMFVQGILFMTLIILIDMGLIGKIFKCCSSKKSLTAEIPPDDVDVRDEIDRIVNNHEQLKQENTLVVDKLYKNFGLFVAVNRISVAVPKGECFGLLGVNGAGKTTSFRMLTGDVRMAYGDAFINGFNVHSQLSKVQGDIGYCPQYNALIDQMTGREVLYMYARIRGIRRKEIPRVVEMLEKELMLVEHAKKQTYTYSGGNKRKLSTAIALIGDPSIVFLDEPTTGMDPAARRKLWNVLSDVRSSGRTLVFTSHSMEECDVLCTRIAIMVNGMFRCLGSPQHLKSKFSEGYTLTARVVCPPGLMAPDLAPVRGVLEHYFPSHRLLSAVHNQVSYSITEPLSHIFGVMESEIRTQYGIEDYSVSQTTLDQIFIEFAKGQIPSPEIQVGCCRQCMAGCC